MKFIAFVHLKMLFCIVDALYLTFYCVRLSILSFSTVILRLISSKSGSTENRTRVTRTRISYAASTPWIHIHHTILMTLKIYHTIDNQNK